MSYRPQRTFNGTQGNPSTDTMGPEQLSHDIDELCKMFNPTSIHSDGSAGGVTADNLNFTGLDINEIGGVASGDIKAIRVKMNGDIEYTTDGETYHPAFAREANYLPLAGGTMSGTLNMNNNKITNLATPEAGSDPATKNYTDAIRTALEVAIALKAPIESPTFTGTPTAPTPSTADSSTQIATTAFTQAVAAGVAGNTYSKADADAKFETIANANKLVKDVSYNSETGTFTIVTQDGTTTSIDTNIEKIPVSVSIIQSGSTYKLRITNEDGSYSECDVSAMFNAIIFVDSTEIAFTETTNQDGSKNVTASIKPGSIVGSKLDPDYKDILDALVDRAETAETNAKSSEDNAADSATAAAGSASAASSSASAAASSVTSASQYASAAEGFKNQASNSATAAASSATEAATSASNASTSETNAAASASNAATSASNAATSASDAASDAQRTQELTNEAMEYATDAAGSQIDAETAARNAATSANTATTKASEAATSASNASTSETNAANSASAAAASAASVGTQASDAEAAARGTRNGVPVSSTDEFYNDNAKYYKDQAAAIVGPQQPKITATGILKGEGDGVVSAAVAGTDYQAPLPSQSGQSGKFLTTDGSALSWADNPPELFWVHVFYDYEQEKYVADKTCAEIESAYNEGKLPCAIYRDAIHYFAGCNNMDDVIYISFLGIANAYGRASFISMDSVGGVHEPENVRLAPLDSPDFTGTPTTPDLTSTSDGTQIANKNYVDNHTPDLSGYMQKGVDYVTAGQKSGTTLGTKSTSEGSDTTSIGEFSHAEGEDGYAIGKWSHKEGRGQINRNIFTTLNVTGSANTTTYTVGSSNDMPNIYSIVGYQGSYAYVSSTDDQNLQFTISSKIASVALSNEPIDYLNSQYLPGFSYPTRTSGPTVAFGPGSHVEGVGTIALGSYSHAEGKQNTAVGNYSHVEGSQSIAMGGISHAEGAMTHAIGAYSHTEGCENTAKGRSQHIFGEFNLVDEYSVHAYTLPKGRMRGDANGDGRITQEDYTLLNDYISRTATLDTVGQWCADTNNDGSVLSTDAAQLTRYLSGLSSALTGVPTLADYYNNWTYVKVDNLSGYWTCDVTISDDPSEILDVKCNNLLSYSASGTTLTINVSVPPIETTRVFVFIDYVNGDELGEYVEIVGNGTHDTHSNARTLDWLGNEVLAGKLTVGADPTNNMDVATKQYVDSKEVPPEVFYINVTGSGTQAAPYTADHTYAEITTALSAGKLPIVIHNGGYYIYGGNSGDYDFYQAGATYIRSFFVTSANVWSDQIDSIVTSVNGVIGDVETSDILPDQTGKDGKFLMTDGSDVSWEAVEPEVFVVTITSSNNTYTADKTYAEITAAADAGKIVVALFRGLSCYLNWVDNNNLTGAWFTAVTYFSGYAAAVVDVFNLSTANVWTFTEIQTQNRITASGILKGNGSGGVTAAVAGTDYVASPEVFIVTGRTSSSEIRAACNAGKIVYLDLSTVEYNGQVGSGLIPFSYFVDSQTVSFEGCGFVTARDASGTYGADLALAFVRTRNAVITTALYLPTSSTTFTANSIIMSGSSGTTLTTRAVTNNTATSGAVSANTNIPTMNTLRFAINRTTSVAAADTGYTTYMARGEALNSADTNPTVNGAISWTYA